MGKEDRNKRVGIGYEKLVKFFSWLVALHNDFSAVSLFYRYVPLPVYEIQPLFSISNLTLDLLVAFNA